MKLIHNGKPNSFTLYAWLDTWDQHPERRPAMEAMVREGVITCDDGTPLRGITLQRVRDRLLGTYDDLPAMRGRRQVAKQRRFLIPGLWAWGTIPSLGGNCKAGKSTIVTDLARSLLVPGYRFLDHFEPVELTEDERDLGVVVINAETPPEDFQAALDNGMTDEAWDDLTVEHLEDSGGAPDELAQVLRSPSRRQGRQQRMRLGASPSGRNDAAFRDPVAWDKRCSSSEGGGAPIHPWLPKLR